ncbi:MAG: NAD-glutamate dehydrogenase [Pseudomonadota bacterium]
MRAAALKKQQKNKNSLIQDTLSLSNGSGNKDQLTHAFIEKFLLQVPAEDIIVWQAEQLAAIAKSMRAWSETRPPGQPRLRVFNPKSERDGWQINRTVIEIIDDDMPFLIDSIAAGLTESGQVIEVLFHPVMGVVRDDKAVLKSIDHGPEKGERAFFESYIHIQLENLLSEESCEKLALTLEGIVKDVGRATGDWHAMLSRLEVVIEEMSNQPVESGVELVNEGRSFLQYIHDNNFTFLGYRQDEITQDNDHRHFEKVKGSGLGLLSNGKDILSESDHGDLEVQTLEGNDTPVVISKLINQRSTVHRRVPFDLILVKILNKDNELVGRHVFIGLFTSSTYSCRTNEVPIIRRKVQETISKASFGHDSHDHKALEHILEKFPRDELFQVETDELVATALGILRLQERQRIALFTRLDKLGKYMSCLVYIPRDRFDSGFRIVISDILERELGGTLTSFYTTLDDSPLARILFTISLSELKEKYDVPALEQKLIEAGRGWNDALKQVLSESEGKQAGLKLFNRYQKAFNQSYQDQVDTGGALQDILQLEDILDGRDINADLYQLKDAAPGQYRLKIYHDGTPVPLSDILPILEKMGMRVIAELPYETAPEDHPNRIWIHDFSIETEEGLQIDIDKVKADFEEAFLKIWYKKAENDRLNHLIMQGGLTWLQVNILRTYLTFLRQAKFPYSRRYIETVLTSYPGISGKIVEMFLLRHDPANQKNKKKLDKVKSEIMHALENVAQLDHDRILRGFVLMVESTLRTNFFQKNEDGSMKDWLSIKLDSQALDFLPKPRPFVEIFVYSPRVEAVHLRGGAIARGGIRWSDRHDDFRTEVLGLVKAQMVKNAVIVPVGAKGGFVVKNPPKGGDRQAIQEEGIACYKIMIQALLDLTDNNRAGKVIKPENTVCYDGDDPYLVVAADKGTATFSDIANGLSVAEDFWLGDAFASGGSAGYDHKEMGITARGAWESVKRHFRERGKDIQKEDFTCIGVGDMGGDVFGNGMLLSKHIQLLGAFNHLHIFCDPDPDSAVSFKERQRLFKARGGWGEYNEDKLSKGGRIYERSAKKLKLTPEIQACFGLETDEVPPGELIRAMLKAEAELLWFGGIGTYIKGTTESHADADDRGNDNLRIDGKEVRAKVIGEGANLGMTQRARIEFAERGGRLNTDFIDNSAGVDTSDHEVNIKILLHDVMKNQDMSLKQRDELLVNMTEQVGKLVLQDNYQQTQALTMCQYDGPEQMARYIAYIRQLEKRQILDRKIEGLPDDETLERMINNGEAFTRPEFAVILAYSKIQFYEELLGSRLPNEEGSLRWLFEYFPDELQKYDTEIKDHKLRREIITTNIVNTLINRMGPVFVKSRIDKTGARASNVARAFVIGVEAFGTRELWHEIEALDNKVSAEIQTEALMEVFNLLKRAVTWVLRHESNEIVTQDYIGFLKPGVEKLTDCLEDVLPDYLLDRMQMIENGFKVDGLPENLSRKLSRLRILVSACDILTINETCSSDLKSIAKTYFDVGKRLQIDLLREEIRQAKAENHWEARVLGGLNDDLYIYQAKITETIIKAYGCPKKNASYIERWVEDNQADMAMMDQLLEEIWHAPLQNIAMLVLAAQRLRYLAGALSDNLVDQQKTAKQA